MKLAVIKLGARIVFGKGIGTSGGSGEAGSIINMLVKGGAEVNCFTKILKKDESPNHVIMHQISDEYQTVNDYDALIVINGKVNFFGGAEDKESILNYWMINNFKGKVIYVYCDPNLSLSQIWKSIESKEWSSNWKKEDIYIDREIDVICQHYNLEESVKNFKDIKISSIQSYEFQKFPMMFGNQDLKNIKNVDISYGGTFRSGRREKKLIDFYFGYDDLKVEVFGKVKNEDFNKDKILNLAPPLFTKAVNYDKILQKMNEAKYHIVIGDNHYPKIEMISQRVYESIKSNTITFVDESFDKNKRIFGSSKYLSDILYVKDREDVKNKIKQIEDNHLYDDIIKLQYETVNFNEDSYCKNFTDIIKSIL